MFTLFHLFGCLGTLVGLVLGASWGYRYFGIPGDFVGALVGAYAGFLLGRLPGQLTDWDIRRGLRREATGELWASLHDEKCLTPNCVLGELCRRGEPMEEGLRLVLGMMLSEDRPRRLHGWAAFISVFRCWSDRIADYSPDAPADTRREALSDLQNDLDAGELWERPAR